MVSHYLQVNNHLNSLILYIILFRDIVRDHNKKNKTLEYDVQTYCSCMFYFIAHHVISFIEYLTMKTVISSFLLKENSSNPLPRGPAKN